MYIIFKKNLKQIDQRYTVLDLDTFSFPDGSTHTACCVVENIPITEMSETDNLKQLHAKLIENYAKKDWDFCLGAIQNLTGKWGGELDSFYTNLHQRINELKTQNLDDSWTPVIPKQQ